jgi:hypothetical protein
MLVQSHFSSFLQGLNSSVLHYYVSKRIVLKFDISTMISIKCLHSQYPILHQSSRPYYEQIVKHVQLLIIKEKNEEHAID